MRGAALVVPVGLLRSIAGGGPDGFAEDALARKKIEQLAMDAVLATERALGREPCDVSAAKVGYDIESRDARTGRLRFLEVKGRVSGADTVTVTKNEILTSLNKPDDFILALVEFLDGEQHRVRYLREPFHREPDFGVTSVNYDFAELLVRSKEPS